MFLLWCQFCNTIEEPMSRSRRIRISMPRVLLLIILFLSFLINPKPESMFPTQNPPDPVTITPSIPAPSPLTTEGSRERGVVTKIIDGDTIQINGTEKIRYIGINSPEIETHSCFAEQASERNSSLVLGKHILMEKDVSEVDKYDRKLRYIYLEDGTFVNKVLLEEGYAKTLQIKPDTKHAQEFKLIQEQARAANKGLWGACQN